MYGVIRKSCPAKLFHEEYALVSFEDLRGKDEVPAYSKWFHSKGLRSFFCLFFFQMQFYLHAGRTLALLTILILYFHLRLHSTAHILTLFMQANRTSIYTTYNTNIILTFTLHCTAGTYTIYTSTNYNTYNTISNHLIKLQLAYLQF